MSMTPERKKRGEQKSYNGETPSIPRRPRRKKKRSLHVRRGRNGRYVLVPRKSDSYEDKMRKREKKRVSDTPGRWEKKKGPTRNPFC